MVFTKYTKNDHPREGKKVVFLRFLAPNTWFPHDNNAISHSFFHGVSLFGLGLILGVFWVSREHLWEPRGTHWSLSWVTLWTLGVLGVLLGASWTHLMFSWVTLCPLWSLVVQIWASVGWLCLPWGQIWLLLGIWFVNNAVCPIFGGHWLSSWIFVSAGLDLGYITFLMVAYFFTFLMVEWVTTYLYHLHLQCSWHCWYLCIAFVGNELLIVCKCSSLID